MLRHKCSNLNHTQQHLKKQPFRFTKEAMTLEDLHLFGFQTKHKKKGRNGAE